MATLSIFICLFRLLQPIPRGPLPLSLQLCLLCISALPPCLPLFHSPFYRYCPFFVALFLSLSLAQSALCALPEMYQVPLLILIFLYISVCVCVCCAIWLLMGHTIEAFVANCKLKTVDMTKGCQEAKNLCKLIQFDSRVRPQMSLAGKWKMLSLLPLAVWRSFGGCGMHKQLNFHMRKWNVLIVAFTTLSQSACCCAFDFNKKKFPKQIFWYVFKNEKDDRVWMGNIKCGTIMGEVTLTVELLDEFFCINLTVLE